MIRGVTASCTKLRRKGENRENYRADERRSRVIRQHAADNALRAHPPYVYVKRLIANSGGMFASDQELEQLLP